MTTPQTDPPGGARANGHAPPGADVTSARPPAAMRLEARGGRLPPLRRHDDATVAEVRRRVTMTAEPLHRIAAATGVSPTTVGQWARDHNWRRPEGSPPARVAARPDFALQRERLMTRLYRALGRQLDAIERRGRDPTGDDMTEKDARALGTIAKTLDTLATLDRDDGGMQQEPEFFDRDVAEAELAERIKRWAQGGE